MAIGLGLRLPGFGPGDEKKLCRNAKPGLELFAAPGGDAHCVPGADADNPLMSDNISNPKCPICSEPGNLLRRLDASFIQEKLSDYFRSPVPPQVDICEYHIVECPRCRLQYASPMDGGDDNFYSWITSMTGYYPQTRWEWPVVLEEVKKSSRPGATVLEVGCGSGLFLRQLSSVPGIRTIGLDPTENATRACRAAGLEVYGETLDQYGDNPLHELKQFDFICAFHCLEHVQEPRKLLESMLRLTHPHSQIFLSTPYSPMSFETGWYDPLNHPPHHLTRWNAMAYKSLAALTGCRVDLLMPRAASLVQRTLTALDLAAYGPGRRVPGRMRRALSHPFRTAGELLRQTGREVVQGQAAPDVVLARFRRDGQVLTTEPLDVLLAVTELGPGGTDRYVEDLAIALTGQGFRVAVAVDGGSLMRKPSLDAAGVPVHILGIDSTCKQPAWEAAFSKLLSRYQIGLIHANVWFHENWLRALAHDRNIPFVVTGHHTVPRPRLRDWLGLNSVPFFLYNRRRMLSVGNAGTICISDTSLRNHQYAYGAVARAMRVYCGRPDAQVRATPGLHGTSPRIVWAGGMIHRKRPFLALAAFEALSARFPESKMEMLGEGELLPSVRAAAAKFGGRVSVPGHVADVSAHLSAADLFLQTSAAEGLSLAIVEAMSAGLPVVATRAGATEEIVRDSVNGCLVPVDSQPALEAALVALASTPALRSEYGMAARRTFEEQFTHQRMVSETLRAYETLVGVRLEAAHA